MEQTLKDMTTLTGLSQQDYDILRKYAPQLEQWADGLVKVFYDTLYAYEPTAAVFKDDERKTREGTLKAWYLAVICGNYDVHFWRQQWAVGLIHIAKRVTNPYMFGMTSRLQQVFLGKCLRTFELDEAERVYSAFKRMTDTIAGIIAEGYFTNYIEAMENVGGFKLSLLQRMMELEINKKLSTLKS
ncbi:protoglobin domain-containing protein [Beggiatoa leptomitoformis]|uniref:Globin-sensor domain-containing protein n=1 Tax=Beggiatoa leptomitoformis TaxID=288004 RepID=A0A2N9YDU0_9GAMM|nr:protoglobin domain-containing protein [Beggiatoa leptomitoformis]AUI68661.1 hypothetical protein BLE401_08065 [Beggiatoa leptomitoformis]QGX03817.1 hypothetical protein AL038_19470 [Beggiatoa leptomitoformis]